MSIQPFIVKRSKVLPMFSLLSNTVVHPHNSLSPENMVAVIPQPLTQQNPTNLHTPSVRMIPSFALNRDRVYWQTSTGNYHNEFVSIISHIPPFSIQTDAHAIPQNTCMEISHKSHSKNPLFAGFA